MKKRISMAVVICALLVVVSGIRIAVADFFEQGEFVSAGTMTVGRAFHTATSLNDGRVLLVGGSSNDNESGLLKSAELFDLEEKRFFPTNGMLPNALASHTAILLLNGRVLIDGGDESGTVVAAAELYDPKRETFPSTGSMTTPRVFNTVTLFTSGPLKGDVLVTGGLDNSGTALSSAELYLAFGETFTLTTGSMAVGRSQHTATLLTNGKVLIAGGIDNNGNSLSSAEVFDPATQLFTPTGPMTTARGIHTAALLDTGDVLVAGGIDLTPSTATTLSSAEVYHKGIFRKAHDMNDSREDFTATLMPDDSVLMTGGIDNDNVILSSAELFRGEGFRGFRVTGSMKHRRWFHTATLLTKSTLRGEVLVTGGLSVFTGKALNSAELYMRVWTTSGL